MTEQLHHDPWMDAGREQQSGGGVPTVVQPDLPYASLAQQLLPGAPVGALVDGSAVRLREYESVLFPDGAGELSLGELLLAMEQEVVNERTRQCQGAAAARRLGLLEDQTLSRHTMQTAAHAQRARSQVDVVPHQAKRL